MHKYLFLLLFFSRLICADVSTDPILLLADDNCTAFEKKGGSAEYSLINGVLTGVAAWDTPNTFLCTKEKYDDFILDFQVKVDPRLNSGVQIRSLPFVDKNDYEMLRGYQVEIDPSDRGWSGGIYEERDRGWIGNLCANPAGRKAFKNGEWNKYHVEAIGNAVKVWVNGINTVNLLDDQSGAGLIGLQVHAIYDKQHVGATVQWKDIQLRTVDLGSHIRDDKMLAPEINLIANKLSEYEKQKGWILFDRDHINLPAPGFDLRPWHIGAEKFCSFEDTPEPLRLETVGGDFEFKFEYQIDKGGSALLNYGYVGDQYSLVLADDKNLPEGIANDLKSGSIQGKIAATNLSNPDRKKEMRAYDQWAQVHIVVEGNNIKHWLNNSLVLDATIDNFQVPRKQRLLEFQTKGVQLCVRSIKLLKAD